MGAFVGSKKNPVWIWPGTLWVWSYQTTQTLSFALGPRDTATGKARFAALPKSYARKQVYTDEYAVYENRIPISRHWHGKGVSHWVCPKGSGDTNIAEGCNNYLRHRVSYLVRKSPSFARKREWLERRLFFVLFMRNQRIKQAYKSTPKTT